MRNVFLRLGYLNTWSSVGDAVSEVVECLEVKPYQRMYSTGCELEEVMVSPLLLIFSLMSEEEDRMSQLPAPMAYCSTSPVILLLEP